MPTHTELEVQINQLLAAFEAEHGVVVTSIELNRIDTTTSCSERRQEVVTVSIECNRAPGKHWAGVSS